LEKLWNRLEPDCRAAQKQRVRKEQGQCLISIHDQMTSPVCSAGQRVF
jgi:hypothetical protein